MELVAGTIIGFVAWFIVRYGLAGLYTVDQNERAVKTVFGRADRIAVLVYGEVIAFDTPERVRADPRVQEAYLGSVLAAHQAEAADPAEPALQPGQER